MLTFYYYFFYDIDKKAFHNIQIPLEVVPSPSHPHVSQTIASLFARVFFKALILFSDSPLFIVVEDDIVVSPDFYM